jgi:hypothetical protein
MNNNQGSGGSLLLYLLLMVAAAYALIEVVKAVVAAITALLMGLVNICLVVSGILAAYWLYRYISDKQFGQHKLAQKANKLERDLEYLLEHTPEHLHEDITQHYRNEQMELIAPKTENKADVALERTKQVFNIFRRDK